MPEQQQTLTIQQALDLAVQHHTAGRLPQAESIYNQILQSDPDQPVALHLLGVIAHQVGKHDTAVDLITKALAIKPDYAEAHSNLGLALKVLGRHEEAATHCQKTINLKPDFAEAHYNLGVALKDLGKPEDAVAAYHKALGLKPAYPMAYTNLLECVYTLGDRDRFYQELEKIILEDTTNVGVAAISAFASNQFGCHDPYPFCNSPMDFVSVNSIASTTEKESGLLHEIQKQIAELKLDSRSQSLLKSGIQSSGNLFSEPCGALADLNQIIRDEISNYFAKHQTSDCLFIKMWSRKYTLKGWYILMEKGGHLAPHNHTLGWLSGVIYLKMPAREANEGSIEFSLHGNNFPVLDSEYPKKLYRVMEGDLVMFPSSLFHRTMPFYSDETRLCISFDLHLI